MADLEVTLGAKLDQFERDMGEAGNVADRAISSIEQKFSQLNPGFGGLGALGLAATGAIGGVTALLALLKDVNSEVASIDQAAKVLGTTTDEFQKLRFAANSGGIGNQQATTDLENVARLLNDAQRNENSLTKILDANNVAYKDRNGQLISTNDLLAKGAGLIQNAATYSDKIEIAKMLGLTQQWVPLLENGAQSFRDLADNAAQSGAVIDKETIAKAKLFDEAWKKSSAALEAQFKSSLATVGGYFDDLLDKANSLIEASAKARGLSGADGQERFNAIADAAAVASKDALGLAQDLDQVTRVLENYKALGDKADQGIIAGLEEVRAKAAAAADEAKRLNEELQKQQFPTGVPSPQSRPAAANAPPENPTNIPSRPRPEDVFDRAEGQALKRTAEYEAEAKAVGLDTEAKVELKAAADLETAAKRAGIPITQQLADRIQDLAQDEGEAAQKAALANQAFAKQQELLNAVGDQAISVLDGIRTKSLTGAQAVQQLTNFLINAIEKATLLGSGPLAGLFGTQSAPGSGAAGGLLGSLFSGLGLGGGSAPGSITVGTQSFPSFAGGTDYAPGGMALVGENGPELVNLPRGSQIVPNDLVRAGGGGDVKVVINNAPSTPNVSTQRNDNGGIAVMVDFVRGVVTNDLVNGTGIAPTLKKFATASGFKGS